MVERLQSHIRVTQKAVLDRCVCQMYFPTAVPWSQERNIISCGKCCVSYPPPGRWGSGTFYTQLRGYTELCWSLIIVFCLVCLKETTLQS